MNTFIKTQFQLAQAQSDAWVGGLIVCGIALSLAVAIAFFINWRSDCRDFIYRRIWFILIGIVAPLGYWLYNKFEIAPTVQNPGFRSQFNETNFWVLMASFALYAVVGIALMFMFRPSKLGSILGKKKQ